MLPSGRVRLRRGAWRRGIRARNPPASGGSPHASNRRVWPRQVDEGSPSDRDEPPRGVGGHLVPPRRERPDERLLDGVLGRREVRTATDEDAQDPWYEIA